MPVSAQQARYLHAMGIPLWIPRHALGLATEPVDSLLRDSANDTSLGDAIAEELVVKRAASDKTPHHGASTSLEGTNSSGGATSAKTAATVSALIEELSKPDVQVGQPTENVTALAKDGNDVSPISTEENAADKEGSGSGRSDSDPPLDESVKNRKTLENYQKESESSRDIVIPVESEEWLALRKQVDSCVNCELHQVRQQTVFGEGNTEAGLMILGDIPRGEDTESGKPFQGNAGELLQGILSEFRLDESSVYLSNLLKCRTPLERSPQPEQAQQCLQHLQQQITLLKPKRILLLGRDVANVVLGSDESFAELRQSKHVFPDTDISVFVSYHPAYLLNMPHLKAAVFRDMQRMLRLTHSADE